MKHDEIINSIFNMFFLCLLGIGKPWSLCRLLLLYSDCFFIFLSVVSQHELGLATT
jgi:hypothetical protein